MKPTATEQQAYGAMQARLVALLLRYDESGFGRLIGTRNSHAAERKAALLGRYRDLGAIFVLRDELFEDILPRIVRRLSFEAPRNLIIEAPPARGRIDWGRSLDAAWAERPGEAPLLFHTRQFAGIRGVAQQILDGAHGGPEGLAHQAQAQLIPGGNSAYEDLLTWRSRLRALRLLRRDEPATADEVVGADPERDNYLYQIWIFYELADLLSALGRLERVEPRQGQMALRFRWGEGAAEREYMLRHDQGVPIPPVRWGTEPLRRYGVPGVRPDFYLWRVDPPMARVEHEGALFWREPGVVWDAKYYREREHAAAPASPIKRMIADLTLLGEGHGTLLFAFLAGGAPTPAGDSYRLSPADRDQTVVPDQQVVIQSLCPDTELQRLRATLSQLLDDAHTRLREPLVPRCRGVFLDSLSLAERGALIGRSGDVLAPDDLLVCPKPHIGHWRIDLVRRAEHCCRDGRLCHIISQPGAAPPVRPPRTTKELLSELEGIFASEELDALDEAAVEHVISRIEGLSRRFAAITGALQDLGRYEAKLGDIGLDRTLHLLGPTERESLALAIYLRDQLDEVQANDYSASIIHVARVLERELQRRILAIPGLSGADFPHGKPTLGALGGVYRRNPQLWGVIAEHLSQVWVSGVDPENPAFTVSVEQLIAELEQLVHVRNQAAHTTPIPRNRFRAILRSLCAGGPLHVGSLNVLLTAWPGP